MDLYHLPDKDDSSEESTNLFSFETHPTVLSTVAWSPLEAHELYFPPTMSHPLILHKTHALLALENVLLLTKFGSRQNGALTLFSTSIHRIYNHGEGLLNPISS
jgi:hypothetical protein